MFTLSDIILFMSGGAIGFAVACILIACGQETRSGEYLELSSEHNTCRQDFDIAKKQRDVARPDPLLSTGTDG